MDRLEPCSPRVNDGNVSPFPPFLFFFLLLSLFLLLFSVKYHMPRVGRLKHKRGLIYLCISQFRFQTTLSFEWQRTERKNQKKASQCRKWHSFYKTRKSLNCETVEEHTNKSDQSQFSPFRRSPVQECRKVPRARDEWCSLHVQSALPSPPWVSGGGGNIGNKIIGSAAPRETSSASWLRFQLRRPSLNPHVQQDACYWSV